MIGTVIWIAVIAIIVVNSVNRSKGAKKPPQNHVPQAGAYQQSVQGAGPQQRAVTDADRARLEEYRRKKAVQPGIVERAKANSRRFADKDETLTEMEQEHGHSERVGSAVAGYAEKEREEQRMHEEPVPRVEETSLLGSVEDLMTKGFDGNLSFERDFIGEAQDMLAAFTIQRG